MTTPSGVLAWGQAGTYDAIDDRQVIGGVTGYRTGHARPVTVTAGSGLQLTVKGGWCAVVDCGDLTSAVVSSRADQVVTGTAGPASGSRTDVIWLDLSPDNATWTMSVIAQSATTGRTGIAMATLVVPQGANLASQFTITPADSLLERRVIVLMQGDDTSVQNAVVWGNAKSSVWANNVWVLPGRYYRVVYSCNSLMPLSGSLDHYMGIGYAPGGGSEAQTNLYRQETLGHRALNQWQGCRCEYVFRWPVGSAASQLTFRGRIWSNGTGTFRLSGLTGQSNSLLFYVEDMGT